MGDAGALLPPPYALADNPQTLLRHSDLVFIDPVSTGYSRAVNGGKPADFHGFAGDIESVGEVIRLWTTRNGRWMSPKYLCGESYGTTRAAGLARHLQERFGHVPQRADADLLLSWTSAPPSSTTATTTPTPTTCRPTRPSRTTTACTATGRCARCWTRRRSTPSATTCGRWAGAPG